MTDVEEEDAVALTGTGRRVGEDWGLDLHIFLRGTNYLSAIDSPEKDF